MRARALEAIIDVHEAARLLSVAPDFDLVSPESFACDDLSADRGRRLLAPAVVGAIGAVNVMVSRYARFEPEIFAEMPAHPLAEEFLPTIAVFGIGRVCVVFLQSREFGSLLFVSRRRRTPRRNKKTACAAHSRAAMTCAC